MLEFLKFIFYYYKILGKIFGTIKIFMICMTLIWLKSEISVALESLILLITTYSIDPSRFIINATENNLENSLAANQDSEPSFWKKYKKYIIVGVGVIVICGCIFFSWDYIDAFSQGAFSITSNPPPLPAPEISTVPNTATNSEVVATDIPLSHPPIITLLDAPPPHCGPIRWEVIEYRDGSYSHIKIIKVYEDFNLFGTHINYNYSRGYTPYDTPFTGKEEMRPE